MITKDVEIEMNIEALKNLKSFKRLFFDFCEENQIKIVSCMEYEKMFAVKIYLTRNRSKIIIPYYCELTEYDFNKRTIILVISKNWKI